MLKAAAVALLAGLAVLLPATPSLAAHGGPTVCPLATTPAGWDPSVRSYTVPADPSGVLGDDVCGLDEVQAIDLGGDGVEELLMSTFHLDWLLVVRATGVGEWRQMGAQVGAWDAVDFNGDGLIDLWWHGEEGEGFLTYLNTRSSTLQDGLIRFPAWISGDVQRWAIVALADFDRDGAMDVVGAEQDAGELVVRFGADGRRLVLGPLVREADRYHLDVVDADGDQVPDVRVQREGVAEAPVVHLNDGAGRFRAVVPAVSETFSSSAGGFGRVSGGTWTVVDGKYVLSAPAATTAPNANLSVHGTTLTGDFTLTVTGATTATSSSWNDFSVVFGYQDSKNYYYASFNERNDSSTNGVFEVTGGTRAQLADFPSTITAGTPYPVTVQRVGSTVRVSRAGVLLASATDSTKLTGRVGVGTKNDGATFDDLTVLGTAVPAPVVSESFGTTTPSMTRVSGGTWAVAGGRYVLSAPADTSAPNANLAVHTTTLTGDFTLTASAATTATSSSWNDFSIVFGYQDPSNYSYASFNERNDSGTSGVFRVRAGTRTELVDIPSTITAGTSYAITVERVGSTIRVRRSGSLVASTTDANPLPGKVGFGSNNDGGTFDDLRVTGTAAGV